MISKLEKTMRKWRRNALNLPALGYARCLEKNWAFERAGAEQNDLKTAHFTQNTKCLQNCAK